ncbi:MAG TPA: TonB-dependent receptor plug domain-containing protein, partial [Usitatibacter sp.]
MLVAAAASASGSAAGQTPPTADSSAPSASSTAVTAQPLEAITVTGTRRREPVRDVPVQLNTIPADQLEQSGAKTLVDYLATQPGIDLNSGGGPGLSSVTIRGVSTGAATIATVGMYVDDVPFGSSTAYAIGSGTQLDMGLLDLNRVEVLRGPQGTIYGASTMGGLIKYVTNEPDPLRFSGSATLAGSTTAHGSPSSTLNAVLNVPVQDNVAVRFAAFQDHAGGYVDAVGPAAGSDVNTGNTVGGRVSLLMTPTKDFQVKFTATTQEIRRDSKDAVDYDIDGNPVNGSLTKKLAIREPYSIKTGVVGLELDYDMGWAVLNSITSGQKTDVSNRTDATYVYGPLLASIGLPVDQVPLDNLVTVSRQTQELRLTSPRGVVEWLVGYFYSHEKGTNDQLVTSRISEGVPGPQLATFQLPSEYTENAFFGDITWNPSKALAITGGMRTSKNKQ